MISSKKDIQDNINHLGFIMVWFSSNKQDENKISFSYPKLEYGKNPTKEFCNTFDSGIFGELIRVSERS